MQKACHETAAPHTVLLFAILGLFKKQSFLSRLQGLLLCCDFENELGVVDFNFTEALKDTLTEQERSILTLHY